MKTKLNKWMTHFFAIDMNDAINEGVINFSKVYGKTANEEPKLFAASSINEACKNDLKPNLKPKFSK